MEFYMAYTMYNGTKMEQNSVHSNSRDVPILSSKKSHNPLRLCYIMGKVLRCQFNVAITVDIYSYGYFQRYFRVDRLCGDVTREYKVNAIQITLKIRLSAV